MQKKPLITPEEREAFKSAVTNVTPLPPKNIANVKKPQHRKHIVIRKKDAAILERLPEHSHTTPSVTAEDPLRFTRPGLQTRVIQRLRRGEYPVDAELDLHGLTLKQAQERLQEFMHAAISRHWRCVQIIHGKGARAENPYPVLKNKVNQWLREYAEVLAFCSTRASSGGTGAVWVLLRSD